MVRPIITPEAEEDIDEILGYIAADNFEAAITLYGRLTGTFEMLAENPFAGRERSDLKEGLRYFPSGSYLVFYRTWAGRVAIVRVLHAARDIDEIFS
ncbi:MAG: type II toxin-antitoxin system RelE/ParE family toxin [Acidobacteria bacterium]|nr:type II toxin-antitoxin system RelE/ParE family toxin [Acidobacteriota bacterium]